MVIVEFTSPEFEHWKEGGEIYFRETKAAFYTAKSEGKVIATRKTFKGIESAIGIWSERQRELLGVDMFITLIEEE